SYLGRRRRFTASAIKRSTIPTTLTTFVTPANAPATSLVSAQIRPIIVPTTKRATIAASQYRVRRVVMSPIVVSSRRFASRNAKNRGGRELAPDQAAAIADHV